ncbi:MAG: tripartite tricarboxylate transporter permease [Hyphomicrobiaceae bacterium]
MELFSNLALGFETALTLQNLGYALIGCLLGTLIGVLPGIGPLATISMLLPITYALPPVSALIMLAGIYYGAQYGGSTTAILVNVPGEASSVMTSLDGYEKAKQGRAGSALAIAALGSLFAGCVGTLVLAALAGPMTVFALKFGPTENFALVVLGLCGAIVLASDSLIKSIAMVIFGLLLGLVGIDVNSGKPRFDFGIAELADGIGFITIALAFFGIAEILRNLESPEDTEKFTSKITRLWPTRQDFRRATPAVLRGTALGSLLGVLPGGGAALSAFAAYMLERKVSRYANELGTGAVEGVAAPESANNAASQTSFVPMLTLGLPSNGVMALMVGAMTIHNIQPGPQVMTSNPTLFWGLIASMWIGNLMLVILNLPLIGIWVKLLTIPYRYLFPAILTFCVIGVFSTQNNVFDIYVVAAFSVLAMIVLKLGFPPVPLLLGFILGPMMEEHFRTALVLSRGDFLVFFKHPISLALLITAALLLCLVLLPRVRKGREQAFQEDA